MNIHKKNAVTIYIKDSQIRSQITAQTQNMRDEINQKIRDFGPKYYQIKTIFDKISINRDVLFEIGKKLESEYKNIKKDILLQKKNRRMKEAIICWFVQNFYSELTESNSTILNRIIEAQQEYKLYNMNLLNLKIKAKQPKQKLRKAQINKEISQNTSQVHFDRSSKINLMEMKVNTEIDNYDAVNGIQDTTHDDNNSSNNSNFNFDYLKFMNF